MNNFNYLEDSDFYKIDRPVEPFSLIKSFLQIMAPYLKWPSYHINSCLLQFTEYLMTKASCFSAAVQLLGLLTDRKGVGLCAI